MNTYGYNNIKQWEGAEHAFAKQFNFTRTENLNDQHNDIDVYARQFNKETKQWGRGTTYSIKNQMKGAKVFGNITFEMEQEDTRTGDKKPGCVGYSKADWFVYKIQYPDAKHLPEEAKHVAGKKKWLFMRAEALRKLLEDDTIIESRTTTQPATEADNRAQGRKYDRSHIVRVNIVKLIKATDRSDVFVRDYEVPKK